jgi:hypothetical protein
MKAVKTLDPLDEICSCVLDFNTRKLCTCNLRICLMQLILFVTRACSMLLAMDVNYNDLRHG